MQALEPRVPASALWLGWLGALPFIGLASTLLFVGGAPRILLTHALAAYGATILSFLGGVHWGLAISADSGAGSAQVRARLILSVIPSLVGWFALLTTDAIGLFTLAIGFVLMLWVDIRATRLGQAPIWYPNLRVPLSAAVVVSLFVAVGSTII